MQPEQTTIIAAIATQCDRIRNAERAANANTEANVKNAKETIAYFEKAYLPSGSGFDRGCTVDTRMSGADRVVIDVPFHHMDENGHYDGWADYKVVVKMTFLGLSVSVTRGRKDHREFVRQVFAGVLEGIILK